MKYYFTVILTLALLENSFAQHFIANFYSITATQTYKSKVFFVANDGVHGTELFISDGTNGDYKLLKDINPGSAGSSPSQLIVFNEQLFFTAYSPDYGLSLWKSDGTSEGTQLVYGVKESNPQNLKVFQNKLYFTTSLGSIVQTDGTPEGTTIFFQADFNWGGIRFIVFDEEYIFFSPDGRTIYRDDGTTRISFLGPLSWEDVYFRNFFTLNGTLVVIKASTYDGVIRIYSINKELVDLEDSEWTLIKKLDAPIYGTQEIENFTIVSGKLFFSFRTYYPNTTPTDELWICDGTDSGTRLIKSFGWSPHSANSEMSTFFSFKEKLYFKGGNPTNRSLWTSNGSTEGTFKVHDVILAQPPNNERQSILITAEKFFFSGGDGYNTELWVSDGSSDGTYQVFDLEDTGGSSPHSFSYSNTDLYFVTSQQFSAILWSSKPAADISIVGPFGNAIKSGSSFSSLNNVPLGTCKTIDLIIRNKGFGKLHLDKILLSGNDYYLAQQAIPETIDPGGQVNIQITFNPSSPKVKHGILNVFSNDLDESKYIIHLNATPTTSPSSEICEFSNEKYSKYLRPDEGIQSIVLTNSVITERQPVGTTIGEFSNPENSTFELISGDGDMDNHLFLIDGKTLKSNAVFNFNTRTIYSIRVKATAGTLEQENSIRIRVENASISSIEGSCQSVFESMSFTYSSIETNSEGDLFVTTSHGWILRSTNEGENWNIVYAGKYRLSKIAFHNNVGYACGNGILVKSNDGGATWFRLYLPLRGDFYIGDLAMYLFNDQELYISSGEGEIFYTKDGGQIWETRLTGSWHEFNNLFFTSKHKGFATTQQGDLLKTIDDGYTWSAVDLSNLGWSTRIYDMWFKDEELGFITSYGKLYSTSNGGETWNVANTFDGEVHKMKFLNNNLGFVYGGNSIMYKTINGGNSWTPLAPGIYPGRIVGLAESTGKLFIVNKDYYYSYESARALAVSTDEGNTWSVLNLFTNGDVYRIDITQDNEATIVSEDGIYKTKDFGLSWTKLSSDLMEISDMITTSNNSTILISGGHIFKSTDGGITTRKVLTTEQGEVYLPAGKLYKALGNLLFSISWYAIYRSDDDGETWTRISTNPNYYTQNLHFISSDIGYRIELFGSVEKTVDGGHTWSEIFKQDPEASDPFNTVFFLNENIGFKGGNFLQQTTDGGLSWKKINWPFYEIIGIYFENHNHGFVVTRSGNVYETNDTGLTWKTSHYSSSRLFDVQFHNQEIFLVGENGSVSRMNTSPPLPSQPGYIYGPTKVCTGEVAEFHLAVDHDNLTQWSTTANNVQDQHSSVTVKFANSGEYTLAARHFNSCGQSEIRTISITALDPPETPTITGPNPSVAGEEGVEYSIYNIGDDFNLWWTAEGVSNITTGQSSVTVDWENNIENGLIKVFGVDSHGCRTFGSLNVTLGIPVGIETDIENNLKIYPNPTSSDLFIHSSHEGILSIRILDAVGREVKRFSLPEGEKQTVSLLSIASGLYLVKISDGNQEVTKRIVKQ